MSRLSVVVPAYNEERSIGTLLERVRAQDLSAFVEGLEILVVDDGSSDGTAAIAERHPGVSVERLGRNSGKGAAVALGIALSTGDYVLIQDADLEYEPADYPPMLATLIGTGADAVYGSRYLRRDRGRIVGLFAGRHPGQSWLAYLGGRSLGLATLAFTGRYLTDPVTALKLFRGELIRSVRLETCGFETDHEITAKLLHRGCSIREVPIRYHPRSRAEGKKIGARDWFTAVRTLHRHRHG